MNIGCLVNERLIVAGRLALLGCTRDRPGCSAEQPDTFKLGSADWRTTTHCGVVDDDDDRLNGEPGVPVAEQSASTSNTVPLRTYNRLVGTAGRLDSLHVGVYLLQPLAITAGPPYCPPRRRGDMLTQPMHSPWPEQQHSEPAARTALHV